MIDRSGVRPNQSPTMHRRAHLFLPRIVRKHGLSRLSQAIIIIKAAINAVTRITTMIHDGIVEWYLEEGENTYREPLR